MSDPLESAFAHLQKAIEHLQLAKEQYESAKATYQSAKALYETIEASESRLVKSSPLSNLCQSCAAIPLATIFKQDSTSRPQRRKVGDLYHAIEAQSSCIFCKFILEAFQLGDEDQSERLHASLKPRDTAVYFAEDLDGKPWFTKAGVDTNLPACPFVWLQAGPPTKTGEPRICITFEPRTGIDSNPVSLNKKIYPRQRDAFEAFNGSLNYGLVKSWLQKCHTQHGTRCYGEPGEDVPSGPTPEIYLIDVRTRRIVSCRYSDRYIALSYVWGKGSDRELSWCASNEESSLKTEIGPWSNLERSPQLPAVIPQTMEDAIAFVNRLDEKYLWIDLFCIDQRNGEERQRQINSMHKIFASAYLTLVCLDGRDADWGLPGVSRPLLQTAQPTVTLRTGLLTATYIYSIWDHNGSSVWDSRAWTLQERLLSRRCIVFAKTYVSMTCKMEFFHDSMDINLEARGLKTWLGDEYFREDGSGINLDEHEWDFKTFDALLSVYSGRRLTIESDALNACRGSLNRISEQTGYTFCFGIPVQDYLRALIWKPHHEYVLVRRLGFPSYSWLGWIGRSEYSYWVSDMADYAAGDSEHKEAPPLKRRRTKRFKENRSHPESANVLSYPSEEDGIPSMKLTSTIAKFKLRLVRRDGDVHRNLRPDSQQSRTAIGDHWTLLDPDGHALRNVAGEHECFEPTDVFFRVKPEYSRVLQDQDSEADFLFVQHWPLIRDSAASNKWLYDMVSALLIIRNVDGTVWRLASVLLEGEHWYARKPQFETLTLV
jgi:hypothetical protein